MTAFSPTAQILDEQNQKHNDEDTNVEGFQQDATNPLPYVLQEPSKHKKVRVNPKKVRNDGTIRNDHNSDLNLFGVAQKKGTKTG